MLKEFIAHIQKTTQPFVQQVDGSTFVISGNGGVEEIHPAIAADNERAAIDLLHERLRGFLNEIGRASCRERV